MTPISRFKLNCHAIGMVHFCRQHSLYFVKKLERVHFLSFSIHHIVRLQINSEQKLDPKLCQTKIKSQFRIEMHNFPFSLKVSLLTELDESFI